VPETQAYSAYAARCKVNGRHLSPWATAISRTDTDLLTQSRHFPAKRADIIRSP